MYNIYKLAYKLYCMGLEEEADLIDKLAKESENVKICKNCGHANPCNAEKCEVCGHKEFGPCKSMQVNDAKDGKKDKCYYKVKSRYKKWPSAYACMPKDNSEALTREGWKSFDELSVGDQILTYNINNNSLEFSNILEMFDYESASIYEYKDKENNIRFQCTGNHKWLTASRELKTIEEIMSKGERISYSTSIPLDDHNHSFDVATESFLSGNFVRKDFSEKISKFVIKSGAINSGPITCIYGMFKAVWCPKTENSTWVVRQKNEHCDFISITGNSGALVKCREVGAANWGEGGKKKKKKSKSKKKKK